MMEPRGFDQAIRRKDDQFGRGFLVDRIYKTLMSPPGPEWAVRVALNGDWGSGKTSIAKMIEDKARSENHAVGWLYPWKVTASDEVARELMVTVLAALQEVGIHLSSKQTFQKAVGKVVDYTAYAKGLNQYADIAINALKQSVAFDLAFAKPVAEQLERSNKRLLLIIDDLDRCHPDFLPPLLLFMRTAFDVSGFSFLAPFDSDIVAKAIRASNPAWTNADRFLEKVFEFRIPIPDLSGRQKMQFLISCLGQEQILVRDDDVRAASLLLPPTPRAIKALARDIGQSREEIERRHALELSWSALLLATMLRATSLEFYRAYLRDVFDQADAESFRRRTSETREEDLTKLWNLVGEIDEATRRRVDHLVDALEQTVYSDGLDRVRRVLHFLDEHEPLTWKEFEGIVARWRESGLVVAMNWGIQLTGLSQPMLAAEAVTHAVTGFQNALQRIANQSSPLGTDERAADEALGAEYLELALASGVDETRRFDLFSRMLVIYWQAKLGETDRLGRLSLTLLEKWSETAQDDWRRYDDVISRVLPLRSTKRPWSDPEFAQERQRAIAVSETLRALMKASARSEIARRLESAAGLEDAFHEYYETDQMGLIGRVFLDPDDQIWSEPDSPVRSILAKSRDKTVIRENARMVLRKIILPFRPASASNRELDWRLIAMDMEKQPPYSFRWCVYRFVRSETALAAVWAAYTAGDLSQEAGTEAKEMREELILLGASEGTIPLNPGRE